jgi:hypothetical protein
VVVKFVRIWHKLEKRNIKFELLIGSLVAGGRTAQVGESYPFFRSSYYMSILEEEGDCIRAFAAYKEAKVIAAPESWLDLRIKGSQLSQYFRRKSKHSPKGLFAYPAASSSSQQLQAAARYSLHWVSEAHRNAWHVLLDATALTVGEDRLPLSLHRPEFVLCTLRDTTRAQQPQPARVTCLLVRRRSFDTSLQQQPEKQFPTLLFACIGLCGVPFSCLACERSWFWCLLRDQFGSGLVFTYYSLMVLKHVCAPSNQSNAIPKSLIATAFCSLARCSSPIGSPAW